MIPATRQDLDAVCDITARAFDDDPVVSWILRDDHRREEAFRLFFQTVARTTYFPHGEVYINAARTGATMWLPSDKKDDPGFLAQLRVLPTIVRICGWKKVARLMKLQTLLDGKHPTEPHYYLFSIGCLPEVQGQGIGSGLMEPMMRRFDEEQIPAFLENSRAANLPFYQRHGFEVREQLNLLGDGPPMWLMWRAPR